MTQPIGAPRDPTQPDGRQSAAAHMIARGVCRSLRRLNMVCLTELRLPNQRLADLTCISAKGDIWIVEIKSGLADFRSDDKWPEYVGYCDEFYFAVAPGFPLDVLPQSCGLIVADRFDAEIIHVGERNKLPPARRKSVTLSFARTAATRLQAINDPEAALEQ